MEIVIKIDEELYDSIQYELNWEKVLEQNDIRNLLLAVGDGVVIPSGHGRLVDADALEKKMCDRETELGDDKALWESSAVSVALDMFAPTIVEKDKGE